MQATDNTEATDNTQATDNTDNTDNTETTRQKIVKRLLGPERLCCCGPAVLSRTDIAIGVHD